MMIVWHADLLCRNLTGFDSPGVGIRFKKIRRSNCHMREDSFPQKSLVGAAGFALLFSTIHVADDLQRNAFGSATSIAGPLLILFFVLLGFAIGWSWTGKRVGNVLILVLTAFTSLVAISHLAGAGDVPITQIAQQSGVFFVWTVVMMGFTSLSALILSVYSLVKKG